MTAILVRGDPDCSLEAAMHGFDGAKAADLSDVLEATPGGFEQPLTTTTTDDDDNNNNNDKGIDRSQQAAIAL